MIDRFRGDARWLSNFHECQIYFIWQWWPSSEHIFQAMKTINSQEREAVRMCETPGKAKKAGSLVTLRSDWEDIKLDLMREVNRQKFLQNKDLLQKLLETGEQKLVEGNNWGDVYWGVCNGKGQNHLGNILMGIRTELQGCKF